MTRYIDADALIKGIDIKLEITGRDEANKVANAFCEIISRIKNTPTADVVEVVRCGECKYMQADGKCDAFADFSVRPSASDYCSYGIRRE